MKGRKREKERERERERKRERERQREREREREIKRERERELDDKRLDYIKEKGYEVKENTKIKNHIRTHFTCKKPLSTDSLLVKTKDVTFWLCSVWFKCSL